MFPTPIVESPPSEQVEQPASPKTAWAENRTKKDVSYYAQLEAKYKHFTKGNKFVTISEALDIVATKTISLLTTDVKTLKLIGITRERMEAGLKNMNIKPKMLAKRSYAIKDILLATEEEARQLTGSILFIQTSLIKRKRQKRKRTTNF